MAFWTKYQLFQRPVNFFGIRYVFDPAINSSYAESSVRVRMLSSRWLDFLTDPSSDESTIMEANATKH
ncbi:hypothetical protein MRX96_057920 [Rhipicephalus microplus]